MYSVLLLKQHLRTVGTITDEVKQVKIISINFNDYMKFSTLTFLLFIASKILISLYDTLSSGTITRVPKPIRLEYISFIFMTKRKYL